MKEGHGVFFKFRDGGKICVAAAPDYGKAQELHTKLLGYIKAREDFGVTVDSVKDNEDRKLFDHFEKLERALLNKEIIRSGTGTVLLYIKEA